MPSRKIEQQLESLSALKSSMQSTGDMEQAMATLRKALKDRVNLVVAKAAALAALLGLNALIPDLSAAFELSLEKGAERDAQCWAKNALAKALKDLGHDDSAVFVRGLKHVQMEPVWGSHVDTAGTLRSICVLALLQCADLTREDKLWHQMRALTDAETLVRLEAVRALEEMDGREAALLLRLKARMGDKEANITGQALASLLSIEQDSAVAFAAEFLDVNDEAVQAEAALALGISRRPSAIQALIEHWHQSKGINGEAILNGISASRQQMAFDFLLKIVREGRKREALVALEALALHRDSPEICERIAAAAASRGEAFDDEPTQAAIHAFPLPSRNSAD